LSLGGTVGHRRAGRCSVRTPSLSHVACGGNTTTFRTNIQSTSIIIKIYDIEILVTAVYKPPSQTLDTSDLDTLTQSSAWSISAGDFNAKHSMWNSRTSNTSGSTLYNHVRQNDYAVTAPTSLTHHPYSQSYRPDVLDIALIKVPLPVTVTNLNDLSSDHNPVLFEVHGTPITSNLPPAKCFINWRKYTDILANKPMDVNPSTANTSDIDSTIDDFTSSIHSAISSSSSAMNPKHRFKALPSYITEEINSKNRLRREWQLYRDPAIKRRLNSKIKFIRTMLSTHKQDEWDLFLNTLNHNDGSVYKLNKNLLHKCPASHPLSGLKRSSFSGN